MSQYIFIDKKLKAIGLIDGSDIIELDFFDKLIGNIYRGRVTGKIDAINGYFVEYEKGEIAFIKSRQKYKIGDNIIFEYVREPANNKKALGSTNFRIENESYILNRHQRVPKPILKAGKREDKDLRDAILNQRRSLIDQENFYPTPKLLYEKSYEKDYLEKWEGLIVKEVDLKDFNPYKEMLKDLVLKKLSYKEYSIIIDSLETLTVIDVNSGNKDSKNNKDKFLENINMDLIPFIVKNLRLRNIGGMVVIDFLRNDNKEILLKEFEKELKKSKLDYEIFGFTKMGLFEISIKRRGDRLYEKLKSRNLIS